MSRKRSRSGALTKEDVESKWQLVAESHSHNYSKSVDRSQLPAHILSLLGNPGTFSSPPYPRPLYPTEDERSRFEFIYPLLVHIPVLADIVKQYLVVSDRVLAWYKGEWASWRESGSYVAITVRQVTPLPKSTPAANTRLATQKRATQIGNEITEQHNFVVYQTCHYCLPYVMYGFDVMGGFMDTLPSGAAYYRPLPWKCNYCRAVYPLRGSGGKSGLFEPPNRCPHWLTWTYREDPRSFPAPTPYCLVCHTDQYY